MLSIVIPVFNVEEYLYDCLLSTVNQTYSDYEIICVNDGSTDNSQEILEQFARKYNRIKLIKQENKGLSNARNTGIKAAKGSYILFLDGDDWIEKDVLSSLSTEIGSSKFDMICFKGAVYKQDQSVKEEDCDLENGIYSGWAYYNKFAIQIRKFHFVSAVLRLYRKEFLVNNKLWFKEGIYHEDNLFTPMACYHARLVKVINIAVYNYRKRSGSITQTPNANKVTDNIIIANELAAFFIPINGLEKNIIYKVIASDYIGIFWKAHNIGLSLSEIKKGVKFKFFEKVCNTPRHKLLFYLAWVHPYLLIFYRRIVRLLR